MKLLLSLLLTAILCASASAQTIRTLGYNSTNGQVVANTGTNVLTFTNAVNLNAGISENGILIWDSQNNEFYAGATFHGEVAFGGSNAAIHAATTRANLGFSTNLNTLWTATNASNARSAVGLGATWLTNTNVTNFRTAIGLGASNSVSFDVVNTTSGLRVVQGVNEIVYIAEDISEFTTPIYAGGAISFSTNGASASATRTNLGLPLAALTNTSNVTMMRALSGSTNTNEPYSGSISVVGTNNTNTLVFSNGILQSVQ